MKRIAIVAAVSVLGLGGVVILPRLVPPPPPPEPPHALALRAGEAPVGVVLRDREDWRGIELGDAVDVLALPAIRGGGPVLIVPGRVLAIQERERVVVVAVSQGEAAKLVERLKETRPMLAVRPAPPTPASEASRASGKEVLR